MLIDEFRKLEAARDESPSLAWLSAQPKSPTLPSAWSARMVATVRAYYLVIIKFVEIR